MSHMIHLVAPIDQVVDEDRFIRSLLAHGHWQPSETGLRYANPDTHVAAALEPLDPPTLSDGYVATGTALVMNYVRPSFWIREVLPPFVDAVTNAYLLVLDPQSSERPSPPDVDRLRHSWEVSNEFAVRAAQDAGARLPWISPNKADAWWRYQRALPQLRLGFAADHYVPSLRLVRRNDGDEVERAMSWPDFVPALLPDCEVVIVLRSDPVRRFEIRGVASAEEVRDRLTPLLEQAGVELPGSRPLTLLPPGRSDDAGRLLATISLASFADLADVRPDALVDVASDGASLVYA